MDGRKFSRGLDRSRMVGILDLSAIELLIPVVVIIIIKPKNED